MLAVTFGVCSFDKDVARVGLALCILASGSSGNCSLLRTPGGVVLIDAGVGPRSFGRAVAGTDVSLADVRAVVLTHLDSDHFRRSWVRTLVRQGITVHCAASHAAEMDVAADLGPQLRPFDGAFEPVAGVTFQPLSFAHDSTGSYGFVIDGYGGRIGFATDLGHVPPALIEHFDDLDVLAIESNYDPDMQRNSGRPWFLQRRITGGHGHLSNEQALAAVKAIFKRHQKRACQPMSSCCTAAAIALPGPASFAVHPRPAHRQPTCVGRTVFADRLLCAATDSHPDVQQLLFGFTLNE